MSISDLMVLRGRVGTDLTLSRSENGAGRTFCRFRMVVPRSRRRDNGAWEDMDPLWYTIRSWGALAENMAMSLRKGQPVVIVGRPVASAWVDGAGEVRSELAINAFTGGHDLGMGGSFYKRMAPGSTFADSENNNTITNRPAGGNAVDSGGVKEGPGGGGVGVETPSHSQEPALGRDGEDAEKLSDSERATGVKVAA